MDTSGGGKDWTGNSKSVFVTLGASNHSESERANLDLYCTGQQDFKRFLVALKRDGLINEVLKPPVWENACGLMDIVEVLEQLKCPVVASDIADRSDWENFKQVNTPLKVIDFLKCESVDFDFHTILTNPPYRDSSEFASKALDLLQDGDYLIMLLRVQYLEGMKRYKLYKESPYKYVYVYVKRAWCSKNGVPNDMSSSVCYSWFLWQKGWRGDTIVRFIP